LGGNLIQLKYRSKINISLIFYPTEAIYQVSEIYGS